MVTGWLNLGGTYYYPGRMAQWQTGCRTWWYPLPERLGRDGDWLAEPGWHLRPTWDANGAMATGWLNLRHLVLPERPGAMATGWLEPAAPGTTRNAFGCHGDRLINLRWWHLVLV